MDGWDRVRGQPLRRPLRGAEWPDHQDGRLERQRRADPGPARHRRVTAILALKAPRLQADKRPVTISQAAIADRCKLVWRLLRACAINGAIAAPGMEARASSRSSRCVYPLFSWPYHALQLSPPPKTCRVRFKRSKRPRKPGWFTKGPGPISLSPTQPKGRWVCP